MGLLRGAVMRGQLSRTLYQHTPYIGVRQPIMKDFGSVLVSSTKVKPPSSRHPKQRTCLEQLTKCLLPNVAIFTKLPPNSRSLVITDRFFKTHRCPLFRGFTVFSYQFIQVCVLVYVCVCVSLGVLNLRYQDGHFYSDLMFVSLLKKIVLFLPE